MKKKKKISLIGAILLFTSVFGQTPLEYMGVIKLNDTSLIPYRINFSENDGIIKGYSVTDMGGEHETKSLLIGTYDKRNNLLKFKEKDIVYTKSPIVQEDFCFVNFEGELKNMRDKKIEGNFRGLYKDGEKCIDGKIMLMRMSSIIKKAEKLNKIIDKSKKVDAETKERIDVVKTVDSLNHGLLNKNENLQVFSNDQNIKLVIFDGGKVDGDIIDLSIDGKYVIEDYVLTEKKKEFLISMKKPITEVEIFALNVGESKPNTVTVEISDSKNYIRTSTNLSSGESTKISLLKKKK